MIQNEKVSVYYGTKEAYDFEKQYGRIDENALYFIEGVLYSGYELYSQDYKKVSVLPDVGQKNYLYFNTMDSSVAIWDMEQNEWLYICKPINSSDIADDDTSIASSSVVYKSLQEAIKYTDDKCIEVVDTIEATIENSIFENNKVLFLGTSDKYNSIADITNALDGIHENITTDLSNIYTKSEVDNKLSTLDEKLNDLDNPEYEEAEELTELESGEKLNEAFGKVAKAVKDLRSHLANKDNPHEVNAEQIGLGNVPNVSTNDQTPTYSAATTLTELESGEKLSTAFGKIAKAVSSLISHIGNKNKPHAITLTDNTPYTEKIIGLIRLDVANSCSGTITLRRTTAVTRYSRLEFSMQNVYNTTDTFDCNYMGWGFYSIRPVKFKYNEIPYAGFYFYNGAAQQEQITLDVKRHGSYIEPFLINVYDTQTKSVVNEEIYNSIEYDKFATNTIHTSTEIYKINKHGTPSRQLIGRYNFKGSAIDLSQIDNGIYLATITNLTASSGLFAIAIVQKSNSTTAYMEFVSKSTSSAEWSITKSEMVFTLSGTGVSASTIWNLVQLNSIVS